MRPTAFSGILPSAWSKARLASSAVWKFSGSIRLTVWMGLWAGQVWGAVWVGPVGYWDDPAQWDTGVPNAAGGWAIANVSNGGTAIVRTQVPPVNEAWAGNGGGPGNIVVTNNGVLTVNNWLVVARMYQSAVETPFSQLIVQNGTLHKSGDGLIVGDNFQGMSSPGEMIVAGTATVNISGGWWGIGNGAASRGTVILRDQAVVNASGYDFNVGDYGGAVGRCFISNQATLNVSRFWVGKFDTVSGALWQNGGAVIGTGPNANEWCIGGENGASASAYGFYALLDGMLVCPFNFQVGRYGYGLLYQSGGTNRQSGWCDTARFAGSYGVTWFSGGRFLHDGLNTRYMIGENGRGEVSLTHAADVETVRPTVFANGQALLVLKGGTMTVPGFEKWAGQAYLAWDGGTLRARADHPAFLPASVNDVRIFAGGAIVDTAGYEITLQPPLQAPVGQGVRSIPIVSPGSGYIGAPIVQIQGDGQGAMAVAQVDPLSGRLTNILITCPGYGYSYAVALLVGGGTADPAVVGTPVLAGVSSGGLTKRGAGTLTLGGANTYTGPTVVESGRLRVSSDHLGGGAFDVAAGATLAVRRGSGATLNLASLAVGGSNPTALELDLGDASVSSQPLLQVQGTLNLRGPVVIHIDGRNFQVGAIPLIRYGARGGTGSLTLGQLPVGVQATLVDNTASQTVDLLVSSVGQPRWEGLAGPAWDVGLTTNWVELSTGQPTVYRDGNPVLFDDRARGTTAVVLNTVVRPAAVVAEHNNLNYHLAGSGRISGTTGLLKRGTGIFVMHLAGNDYTGATRVEGGVLVVTNLAPAGQPSAIGAAAAASTNLVLAGATLRYEGVSTTTDRGYHLQGTNNVLDVRGNLTLSGPATAQAGSFIHKTGPGRLTYTYPGILDLAGGGWPGYTIGAGEVIFDGSFGNQLVRIGPDLWVGNQTDQSASLVLSNTTVQVDAWVAVGRGNGSLGNFSTLTLYNSRLRSGNFAMGFDAGLPNNQARQLLALYGNSSLTNQGDMNLGESGGSEARIVLTDNASLYSAWRVFIGWHFNATGHLAMARNATMTVNAWLSFGHEGGHGSAVLQDDSRLWVLWDLNVTDVGPGEGYFEIRDRAVVSANNVFVGKGAGSTGVWQHKGGRLELRASGDVFQIGANGQGIWEQTGGTVTAPRHWVAIGRYPGVTGTLNLLGGEFSHTDAGRLLFVGEEGNGVLNLSGSGVLTTLGDRLVVAHTGSSSGTVNLDGGILRVRRVAGGAGVSAFHFNGGLLQALPGAGPDLMYNLGSAYVMAGGAGVDTGTNDLSLSQPLLDGGGGLVKLGSGALTLLASNSYSGPTVISNGLLRVQGTIGPGAVTVRAGATLGGAGVISGPVTIQPGGFLAPGESLGTLTLTRSPQLQGTVVMELDRAAVPSNADRLVVQQALTYGGTLHMVNRGAPLQVGDAFQLFQAPAYAGAFATVTADTPGQTVQWDLSRLAVDGTVRVAAVSLPSVTLGWELREGRLTLSWPSAQTGWQLQAQTNSPGIGLSTNWVLVPGSQTTNRMTLPIDPQAGSVFYRLVRP
ncbi:MAG: autotransporter-associated beta strand repeat-containing protein [Verrucomicrobiota bacterium]|nr:autotransporter-associated beta strand repeat-containing protein [Limisphaera sp.]MDW8382546.1 autotransporter-associated beta strand repeat-containing protein [Verrucomicrobiota bacterium]